MTDEQTPVESHPIEPVVLEESNLVSYDTHKKLLDEKKKIQSQLKEILDNEKKRKDDLLLEEGRLKEALELRDKELLEERSKRLVFENREKEARKLSAVIKGLGTSDIEDKWYNVISQHIDNIQIDDDGILDQKSILDVVDVLKKTWPEMIKRMPPGVPNGHPGGGPSTINYDDWMKLSSKEMMKWKPDQILSKRE